MSYIDECDFSNIAKTLDDMNDEECKEYIEDIEADNYLASIECHDSKYL